MPRTSPSELTISVTTRPQPPCRFTSRRKAVSVMPAIGATPNGGSSARVPIFMNTVRTAMAGRAQAAGGRAERNYLGAAVSLAAMAGAAGAPTTWSYTLRISSFFHSMIAWDRSFRR